MTRLSIIREKKWYSHSLKIGQVPYAWGEQAREVLAWDLPAKQSKKTTVHRTLVRTNTWTWGSKELCSETDIGLEAGHIEEGGIGMLTVR